MELLCRVCMNSTAALVGIFAECSGGEPQPSLADMLKECTSCEVKHTDALPQQICLKCALAARNAYQFKRQCEQSYKLLCQLLQAQVSDSPVKQQTHTADGFQCPVCKRQFRREQQMQRHLAMKHKLPTQQKAENYCPSQTHSDTAAVNVKQLQEAVAIATNYEMSIEPVAYAELEPDAPHDYSDYEIDASYLSLPAEVNNGFIEELNTSNTDSGILATSHSEDEAATSPNFDTKSVNDNCYSCHICERRFTTSIYLKRHLNLHERKCFTCKECTNSYDNREELAAHIKEQGHDKPLLCPECGLRCKTSSTLMTHMRRHNGEKPYKCKFCNKGFPRIDDLRVHEKYHTGDKEHFCETCGKGFLRKYNLTIHMRVHTGERPYKCPHCPQAFTQGNDLKSHIRRHTGERFRCENCPASFLQHYKMRQHKLELHGIWEDAPTQRVVKFRTTREQEEQIKRIKQEQQGVVCVDALEAANKAEDMKFETNKDA